jgi:hypothetical protein
LIFKYAWGHDSNFCCTNLICNISTFRTNSTSLSVRDRTLVIYVCSWLVFICLDRENCLYYEGFAIYLSNRCVWLNSHYINMWALLTLSRQGHAIMKSKCLLWKKMAVLLFWLVNLFKSHCKFALIQMWQHFAYYEYFIIAELHLDNIFNSIQRVSTLDWKLSR